VICRIPISVLASIIILFSGFNDVLTADDFMLHVVTEDWKPYSYEEDGKVRGLAADLARMVLEQAEINYEMNVYPWARAYLMAKNEPNTMIFAIVRIEERESLFQWIGQVAPAGQVYLYKLSSRSDIVITSLEESKQYIVGAIRNTDMHQYMIDNDFQNIVSSAYLDLLIKQLVAGRIDLLCVDKATMIAEFEDTIGITKAGIDSVLLLYEHVPYMALSLSTSSLLAEKLQKVYEQLSDEGAFQSFLV